MRHQEGRRQVGPVTVAARLAAVTAVFGLLVFILLVFILLGVALTVGELIGRAGGG